MDNFKRYLPGLLGLGLLAGLVIGFWPFLMADIVMPAALLFWSLWRVVLSVNQNIYWTILILICAILMIQLIPPENDVDSNMAYKDRYQLLDRVGHWRSMFGDAILSREDGELLRDSLRELFASVAEKRERFDAMDLESFPGMGRAHLPIRMQRFLFPLEAPGNAILDLLPKWLRRWLGKWIPQDTASINEILEWMENELEIRHGR